LKLTRTVNPNCTLSQTSQVDEMAEPVHPAWSGNLPSFVTAPGETDVLMIVMAAPLAFISPASHRG
jgi:Asp/Glu/hydantoin racemase